MVLKWVRAQFGPRTDDFRELLVHRLPIEVGLLQEGHGLLVRFVRGGHRARSGASSAGASRSARHDRRSHSLTRACFEKSLLSANSPKYQTTHHTHVMLAILAKTKNTVLRARLAAPSMVGDVEFSFRSDDILTAAPGCEGEVPARLLTRDGARVRHGAAAVRGLHRRCVANRDARARPTSARLFVTSLGSSPLGNAKTEWSPRLPETTTTRREPSLSSEWLQSAFLEHPPAASRR